ncbi:MAG TPA: XrtB/PEP-CTERM-associated polysaccharide biosynthesis outer membrane protein EpsL [Thiobacillus sp.]
MRWTARFTTLILMTVLGMISTQSRANDSPDAFKPFVRAQYGYDSNLFRLQNDQEASSVLGTTDTAVSYHVLAAGLDLDMPVSRQAIRAHAEVNQTRYDQFSMLNFSGHDAYLKWDWTLGSRAQGEVGGSETLTQASYSNVKQPVSNLIRTRRNFMNALIKLDTPWRVGVGLDRTETNNKAVIQRVQNATVDRVNAALQYRTRKGSTLELTSQRSDGQYQNRQVVGGLPINNNYRQWDNGMAFSADVTGKTRLSGKLNYTERSYNDVPQRDFSGLTGLLSMDWAITEKTIIKASVHRDIGALENNTASYTLNHGTTIGLDWRPTSKLVFNTQLGYDNIEYAGDPGFVLSGSAAREDQLTSLQAGIQYALLRNTTIELILHRGIRYSSEALSSYRYNRAILNLRSDF